jgi:hypothetical protein
MDPRDVVVDNRYLGPSAFSVDLMFVNQLTATNWGVPTGQAFVVKLSPQVGEGAGPLRLQIDERDLRAQTDLGSSRVRRKLMAEVSAEFSALHDQLLSDLAR